MTQKEHDKKKQALLKEYNELYQKIEIEIYESKYFDEEYSNLILDNLSIDTYNTYSIFLDTAKFLYSMSEDKDECDKLRKEFDDSEIVQDINTCAELIRQIQSLWTLVDKSMEFCGDIIITDPCYIMSNQSKAKEPKISDYYTYHSIQECPDYDEKTKSSKIWDEMHKAYTAARAAYTSDWEACDYGSDMEVLGINHYMTRDTLYGDWSCTTYDLDTEEKIGEFCADAGLVSVFLLEEVLAYNPDFNYHVERPWTTTVIKNFKGTVEFKVIEVTVVCDWESAYHKIGDTWTDYEVIVEGHGINTETGKPINFIGKQTGL